MRYLIAIFVSVKFAAHATAHTVTVSSNKAYAAIFAPKPDYSMDARFKPLEGRGLFLLHVGCNGTVESVEVIKSTGHSERDPSGITAFSSGVFVPAA